MSANSNTLTLTIEVDDKGSLKVKQFAGEMDKAVKQTSSATDQGAAAIDGMAASTGRLTNAVKGLGPVLGLTLGAAAIAGLVRGALELAKAADAMEAAQKRFDVAFQGQQQVATAAVGMLEKYYSMSRSQAMESLTSTQTLMTGMGLAAGKAASFSLEVAKLSGDLANFNRVPTAQTLHDIDAALGGSYEGLKKYGIVINEQTVSQQALRLGLAKTKDELTSGEKAYAAFTLMVEKSSKAIGESQTDNYTKQLKEFENRWGSLTETLSKTFLPIANEVLKVLNAIAEAARRFVVPTQSEMFDRIASDTAADADRWKLIADAYRKTPQLAGTGPGLPRMSADDAERTYREMQRRSYMLREMSDAESARAGGFGMLNSKPGEINIPGVTKGDFKPNPGPTADELLKAYLKEQSGLIAFGAGLNVWEGERASQWEDDYEKLEKLRQLMAKTDVPTMWSDKDFDKMMKDQAKWTEAKKAEKEIAPGGVITDERIQKIVDETNKGFDAMLELSERTAKSMQNNFSDLFFDAMTGKLKSFEDYATAIFRSVQRAFADMAGQMVTQGLFGKDFKGGGWLSSLGEILGGFGDSGPVQLGTSSAHGNVFGPAGLSKFGAGGIFTHPTFFPMANGGMGLAGEKGFEAIMPLSRTPSGDLGVKASGGGGGEVHNHYYYISAVDTQSFKEACQRSGAVQEIVASDLSNNGPLRDSIMGAIN